MIAGACPQVVTPPPPPSQSDLAGWLLLALFVGAGLLDYWLYRTGRKTMSRWLRDHTKHPRMLKVLGAVLLGAFLWHLFLGGPLPLP